MTKKLFDKFPQSIYVVKFNPGEKGEEYWMQFTDLDEAIEEAASEGSKVAAYTLESLGNPKIERSLE